MENKKIILGLTGEICAGKGKVVEYLKEKYGASSYKFSAIFRDILKRLYLENSRKNIQLMSNILRKNFGEDILAKTIAQDVTKGANNIVVVDGVRRFADIKFLKEISGFKLINIIADDKIRYKRLILRKENPGDENKTFEEFLADHEKEADAEVPLVMEKAELEINNNGSLDDLYKQVDQIIINFNC